MATALPRGHVLVGLFRSASSGHEALHRLDVAGLPPDHVDFVAGDPELAGEVGGRSYAMWGAIGGFVLGLGVIALFVAIGGTQMSVSPVGIVIGGGGMALGLAFIGIVVGRSLVRRARRWREYEHVVENGGAVLAITCSGDECDRAREEMTAADADEIVDQD